MAENKGYNTVQISEIINAQIQPYIGNGELLNADLSNLVDTGKFIGGLSDEPRDIVAGGFISALVKQMIVDDTNIGERMDIIKNYKMSGVEGGVMQKIRMKHIEALNDPSYNPDPGSTNDNFVNISQEFETMYFQNRFAEMFQTSIPENWYQGYFNSPKGIADLISLIQSNVRKSIDLHVQVISRGVLNARMAMALHFNDKHQSINLLEDFNAEFQPAVPLTVKECLKDPEFARYAAFRIDEVVDMMADYNTLTNPMSFPQATPRDLIEVRTLGTFLNAINKYLYTDAFNVEYVKLPRSSKVFKWQGSGTGASFEELSTIDVDVNVPVVDEERVEKVSVKQSGIIATLYHPDAIGIYDLNVRTRTQEDAIGDKTNYVHHLSGSTIADPYEPLVVLYVADPEEGFKAKTAKAKTSKAKA